MMKVSSMDTHQCRLPTCCSTKLGNASWVTAGTKFRVCSREGRCDHLHVQRHENAIGKEKMWEELADRPSLHPPTLQGIPPRNFVSAGKSQRAAPEFRHSSSSGGDGKKYDASTKPTEARMLPQAPAGNVGNSSNKGSLGDNWHSSQSLLDDSSRPPASRSPPSSIQVNLRQDGSPPSVTMRSTTCTYEKVLPRNSPAAHATKASVPALISSDPPAVAGTAWRSPPRR